MVVGRMLVHENFLGRYGNKSINTESKEYTCRLSNRSKLNPSLYVFSPDRVHKQNKQKGIR